MIKLIIFDWDDVITLGAKEGYFACYHKAINQVGVFLTPEEEHRRIIAKWGKSFEEELTSLLQEHPEKVSEACDFFEKEYWRDTFVSALQLQDGVNEMLLRLKEKYILTVATGNHNKMIRERIMPYFHIPNVFSQIVSSHDIEDQEKTKPHPYMLELIMREQNITPEETIYIGDAKTDMQMGISAGVTPIAVLTGHMQRSDADELGVTYILENVTELEDLIEKI